VGNGNGQVLAISASNGQILWRKEAGSPIIASGAILPGAVAFPTEGGNLIAWDLENQRQLWSQPVKGKLYSTPVISGDTLVVAVTEGDNLLQAFSINGQISWPFTAP
jgi:outer membrane protein assembly factor BamB